MDVWAGLQAKHGMRSAEAHQNGLEAKPALRGKPKANVTGVCFFGYTSLPRLLKHGQRLNRRERFRIRVSEPEGRSPWMV